MSDRIRGARDSGGGLNSFSIDAAAGDLAERVDGERERRAVEDDAPEAREEQAQRLESIGELAGGVAHDFNNLLAVIRSNAELALEGVGPSGGVPEGEADLLREELQEVREAADHAAELTSQLLVFSRRESTAHEPVDLNAVVEEIEQLLQRSIGDHIDLEVDLAPGLPPVLVDRNQMEQILLNLAINARDAMPSGGQVSITTGVGKRDERYSRRNPEVSPGKYVQLVVADTGIGMSQHVAARAFEPFFSTKPKGEGTGLGLATVYGIVQASGGEVSIHSEEGSGTEIRVRLPLADAAPESVATAKTGTEGRRGQGQKILLVEDADRVRRAVARVLQRGGYQVVQAADGNEAFEIVKQGKVAVDLLLTDVQMPGITGTELAAKVRAIRPGVPVLFMSAYADASTAVERLDPTIEKPFTMARMFEQVAAALDSATQHRPED